MNTTKTTIKNQIIDYLQITSDDYDDGLFNTYWNWCEKYGDTPSKVQQLLANTKVNKWFMMEYSKMQKSFLDAIPHLPKNMHSLDYYRGFVIQIFTIYPKSMIDELNNNDDFLQMITKRKIYAN